MFKSTLRLSQSLGSLQRVSLPQKRGFVVATLAALTNSSFVQQILTIDKFASEFNDTSKLPQEKLPIGLQPTKVNANGKIELSVAENIVFALVSCYSSFAHPENGMNIANFGESTAYTPIIEDLRDEMLKTASGRKLLREKPSFDPQTLNITELSKLPENTLGHQYSKFADLNDKRAPVRFIVDEELAYVFQRFRQIHDVVHVLTRFKTDLAGEVPVKAFEFGNTNIPMTGLACGAYFKLSAKRKARINMWDTYFNGLMVPALIGIHWESMMERDVDEIRRELGINLK